MNSLMSSSKNRECSKNLILLSFVAFVILFLVGTAMGRAGLRHGDNEIQTNSNMTRLIKRSILLNPNTICIIIG